MNTDALEDLADRATTLFEEQQNETAPSSISKRAVQLRVVEPLLELLGWDVTSESVEPLWPPADESPFEYALLVGGTPCIAVDVLAPNTGVDAAAIEGFTDRLKRLQLSWGIVTDGARFVFLTADQDGWARRTCGVTDLPANTALLRPYTRQQAASRIRQQGAIVDSLQAERAALEQEIAACFQRVAEAEHDVFQQVAANAVGTAIAALDREGTQPPPNHSQRPADSHSGTASTPTDETGSPDVSEIGIDDSQSRRGVSKGGTAGTPTDSTASDSTTTESTDAAQATSDADQPSSPTQISENAASQSQPTTAEQPVQTTESSTEDTQPEREYVVRFFGGSSTVGAVGNPTPAGALYAACSYLQEHRALTNHLTTPWGVDDEYSIIAREPVHPDGTTMGKVRELGQYYVWAGPPERQCKQAIEALADATGLRVMFQGDWEDSDS